MPEALNVQTDQSQKLIQAKACSPLPATLAGLSFANRDMELIEYLKTLPQVPPQSELPSAEACVAALGVEKRWADFVLVKVSRFMHKERVKGDFAADVERFCNRPDVTSQAAACKRLRPGVTAFIGDSHLDKRHFAFNIGYGVLAGSFLKRLGVGPFVNAGIGGEQASHGLARLQRDVLDHKPVRVVVAFGGNDLASKKSSEQICADLETIFSRCRAAGADCVLGPLMRMIPDRLWYQGKDQPTPEVHQKLRQLNDAEADLARRLGIPHANLMDVLTPDDFAIDGVHLNQQGEERCGAEVLKCLSKLGR